MMQNKFIDLLDSRFIREAYLAILSDGSDETEMKALILKRIALSEKLISSLVDITLDEAVAGLQMVCEIRTLPCLIIRDKGHDLLDVWSYDEALARFCFSKEFRVVIKDEDITSTLRKEFELQEIKAKLAELNERKAKEAQLVQEKEYRALDTAVKEWCRFRDAVRTFSQSPEGCEDARQVDVVQKIERIGQIFQSFCMERLREIEEPLKETMDKVSNLYQEQIQ